MLVTNLKAKLFKIAFENEYCVQGKSCEEEIITSKETIDNYVK